MTSRAEIARLLHSIGAHKWAERYKHNGASSRYIRNPQIHKYRMIDDYSYCIVGEAYGNTNPYQWVCSACCWYAKNYPNSIVDINQMYKITLDFTQHFKYKHMPQECIAP